MDAPTSAHQDDAGIDENAEPAPILPYGTYILPADARPAGDDKPGRRRVLCTETTWTVLGTVVYGSSQTAPFKQKGLHRVPILGRGEPNPNGFTVGEQFYLYPSCCGMRTIQISRIGLENWLSMSTIRSAGRCARR